MAFGHGQRSLLSATIVWVAESVILSMGRNIKKLNLFDIVKRWLKSRAFLLRELDGLRQDNEQLRAKVAALQNAKVKAERSLEERRREKEALRARLTSEKRASESKERIAEQLGTKIAELRDENDRLIRSKKPKK